MLNRKLWLLLGGAVVIVVICSVVATIVVLNNKKDGNDDPQLHDPTEPLPPSESKLQVWDHAAISCDSPRCAAIGRDILQKGGKVADAAVASLLCMGVIHAQSMGIGGGFLMVYYDKATKKAVAMNARETAPGAATEDMYAGNSSLAARGPLSVAVPGEMKGYWDLYKRFGGGVPWKTLVEPTIEICKEGFLVDEHTVAALNSNRARILRVPSMKEILVDPKTNDVYKLGDTIKRPKLAETLQRIADSPDGGDLLYKRDSELAQWLVEDLKAEGGIITLDDLANYTVEWDEAPIAVKLHGDLTLYATRPPGSGALMAFIMRVLNDYRLSPQSKARTEDAVTSYHYIFEAFKHAYAQRTVFGDPSDPDIREVVDELVKNLTESQSYLDDVRKLIKPDWTSNDYKYYGAEFYQTEDHGTSHISIVGENGDAISVTSTVNLYFGAVLRSPRTGIIYNDEMDDFSAPNITNSFGVPPSPNNFIKPGKRPLSSMTPAIFTNGNGDIRLVLGTAGGTRITTATTYVAIRNLWFNDTIKESIDSPRIHHQLAPMEAEYEYGFLDPWVTGLKKFGHKMSRATKAASVVMGIARYPNGSLAANCDYRKPCSIDGY